MKTKAKLTYQSPITSVIQLESSNTLLAGSVEAIGIKNVKKNIINATDW